MSRKTKTVQRCTHSKTLKLVSQSDSPRQITRCPKQVYQGGGAYTISYIFPPRSVLIKVTEFIVTLIDLTSSGLPRNCRFPPWSLRTLPCLSLAIGSSRVTDLQREELLQESFKTGTFTTTAARGNLHCCSPYEAIVSPVNILNASQFPSGAVRPPSITVTMSPGWIDGESLEVPLFAL